MWLEMVASVVVYVVLPITAGKLTYLWVKSKRRFGTIRWRLWYVWKGFDWRWMLW